MSEEHIHISPDQMAIEILCDTAANVPPEYFQRMLVGILGSVLAAMPKEYFDKFKVCEPCGGPDCVCHVHAGNLMPPLETLRDWAISQIKPEETEEPSQN